MRLREICATIKLGTRSKFVNFVQVLLVILLYGIVLENKTVYDILCIVSMYIFILSTLYHFLVISNLNFIGQSRVLKSAEHQGGGIK